jgi:hypothetical protein
MRLVARPIPPTPFPEGKGEQVAFPYLWKKTRERTFPLLQGRGRGRGLFALLALFALLPSALFAQDLQIPAKIAFGSNRDGNNLLR